MILILTKNFDQSKIITDHLKKDKALHTEVRFDSFLSGGFITAIVVNPPERKLAKSTSVHWMNESVPVCFPLLDNRVDIWSQLVPLKKQIKRFPNSNHQTPNEYLSNHRHQEVQ
jgi:hypothetical protein